MQQNMHGSKGYWTGVGRCRGGGGGHSGDAWTGIYGLRAGMSILQCGSPLRTSHYQPASLQSTRKHQTEGSTLTKASSVVEELAKAFCRGGRGDLLISE